MKMNYFGISRRIRLLCCGLMFIAFSSLSAEIRFFDGFGDADLDNNGIPNESNDVDINFSINAVPPVIVNSYTPPEFPGATVNEVGTVLDSSDVGLKWFSSAGFSNGGTGDPKANVKIMNDALGAMPDSTHATYPVPSFDTGYALAYDSKGRGSSATAFFGERVALGPEVGDQVKVSFDYRTWLSGPNANTFTPPRGASLRFGLYQDTDNQLGMTNPFAGLNSTPAVWGESHGQFRGDIGTVGATEDRGWYTAIDIGRADDTSAVASDFTGRNARINEETNSFASGGRFMEGGDNDFVARTDQALPTFTALDVTKVYNLALTLERATDVTPGDTIRAIYTVTERASGMSWSIEGTEKLMNSDGMGGFVPDGISSDSWDYFGIRNTTTIASGVSGDDYDFLLDNFKLEVFGSNTSGPVCDFNADSACNITDLDSLYGALGTTQAAFDLTGDGTVDGLDIDRWLVEASAVDPMGRTFKDGDADLNGAVGGSDFTRVASNFGITTGTWGQGNFDGVGGVSGADFTALASNFGFTSVVNAVPEPGSLGLWLIAAMGIGIARKRK